MIRRAHMTEREWGKFWGAANVCLIMGGTGVLQQLINCTFMFYTLF